MAPTVLIVEGDAGRREYLSDLLERQGFAVVTATTGRQALALLVTEAVTRAPIDGILLDLELSGLDALTTLRDIRDRHEEIPVAIMTDGSQPDRVQTAIDSGAIAVLRKPVDPDLLRQVTQVFFRDRGPG